MPRASTAPLPGSFTQGITEGSNAVGGLLNSLMNRAATRERMQNAYLQTMMAQQFLPFKEMQSQAYVAQQALNAQQAPALQALREAQTKHFNLLNNPGAYYDTVVGNSGTSVIPVAQITPNSSPSMITKPTQNAIRTVMLPNGEITNADSIEARHPEATNIVGAQGVVNTAPATTVRSNTFGGLTREEFIEAAKRKAAGLPALTPEQLAEQAGQQARAGAKAKADVAKASQIETIAAEYPQLYKDINRAQDIISNNPGVTNLLLGISKKATASLTDNQALAELGDIFGRMQTAKAKLISGNAGHITNMDQQLAALQKPDIGSGAAWNLGMLKSMKKVLLNEYIQNLQRYQKFSGEQMFPFDIPQQLEQEARRITDPTRKVILQFPDGSQHEMTYEAAQAYMKAHGQPSFGGV